MAITAAIENKIIIRRGWVFIRKSGGTTIKISKVKN